MSHVKKLPLAQHARAGILQRFAAGAIRRPPRSPFQAIVWRRIRGAFQINSDTTITRTFEA